MCGIVGVIGRQPAAEVILTALRRLEYRGYDSAGIATLVDGEIDCRRSAGKLDNLSTALQRLPLRGTTGIGHTRWATHGAPTEANAHPHSTPRVSVVHNGIIENYEELRRELEALGQPFKTETDTEVVAQLVDFNLKCGSDPIAAAFEAFLRLEGCYAIAMIFSGNPDLMIGVRRGAPLAVGFGDDEMFVGSDSQALAPLTDRITYLEEDDRVVVDRTGARVFDRTGTLVERPIRIARTARIASGKRGFQHFMEKEMHEHPAVIKNTLQNLMRGADHTVSFPGLPFDFTTLPRVTVSACGSAFYAGLVARYWLEKIADLPTDADVASEVRYRSPPLARGGLGLLVSQSGETADTLAALRYMRERHQHIVSVLNVPESSMARESDMVIDTLAGQEVGVASTKAFTAQLVALACMTIAAARARQVIDQAEERSKLQALMDLPRAAERVLHDHTAIRDLAPRLTKANSVLFLGRGELFPIAMEGALKLKEISYIHAEAYAAGELKHGPIALVDTEMPVVALAPSTSLFAKTASNLQEVAARGGQLLVLTDEMGAEKLRSIATELVVLPTVDPFVAPILYAIGVQLLAYYVAVAKGCDVDQPRNLAKSVTVE